MDYYVGGHQDHFESDFVIQYIGRSPCFMSLGLAWYFHKNDWSEVWPGKGWGDSGPPRYPGSVYPWVPPARRYHLMVLQLNNRWAFSVYFPQQGTHPIGRWTLTSSSFLPLWGRLPSVLQDGENQELHNPLYIWGVFDAGVGVSNDSQKLCSILAHLIFIFHQICIISLKWVFNTLFF